MSRINVGNNMSAVRQRPPSDITGHGPSGDQDRGRSRETARSNSRNDGASLSSRVPEIPSIKQLRSRFQPDDAGLKSGAKGPVRSVAAPTAATGPEIRTNRGSTSRDASARLSTGAVPSSSAMALDPEKYFESTNHTQRFLHTRALFAKMEEQTIQEQERRRMLIQRSKSPTRFPASSPNYLALSPAVDAQGNQLLSPSSSSDSDWRPPAHQQQTRPHQAPASSNFNFTSHATISTTTARVDRPRISSTTAAESNRGGAHAVAEPPLTWANRASSVDRLDDDGPIERRSLRSSAYLSSRSETDLGRTVSEEVPSPKWIMQHYEEVVKKTAGPATYGGQIVRRRSRPSDAGETGSRADVLRGVDRRSSSTVSDNEKPDSTVNSATVSPQPKQNVLNRVEVHLTSTKPAVNTSYVRSVSNEPPKPTAVRYGRPEEPATASAVLQTKPAFITTKPVIPATSASSTVG